MNKAPALWFLWYAVVDGKRALRALAPSMLAAVLGFAAVVAVYLLSRSLKSGMDVYARELLGADVTLAAKGPIPKEVREQILRDRVEHVEHVQFRTMARVGTEQVFVQVRAIGRGFPFFGKVEAQPPEVWNKIIGKEESGVLIDTSLRERTAATLGSSIVLGTHELILSGVLRSLPTESSPWSALAPNIYISRAHLDSLGLLGPGSLATHTWYLRLPVGLDAGEWTKRHETLFKQSNIEVESYHGRREVLGRLGQRAEYFCGLTAVAALILGILGAVIGQHFFLERAGSSAATLRCLGALSRHVMAAYFFQLFAMSVAVALAGTMLGMAGANFIADRLKGVLPVDIAVVSDYWALLAFVSCGIFGLLCYAVPSLSQMRNLPPLTLLRPQHRFTLSFRWVSAICISALLGLALCRLFSGSARLALVGTSIVGTALVVLAGNAFVLKRSASLMAANCRIPFPFSHAFLNLRRPGNQTVVLMMAVGLSVMLAGLLIVSRHILESARARAQADDRPNLFFFDVQSDQREKLREILRTSTREKAQETPVVLMHLTKVAGRMVSELLAEPAREIPTWTLRRDYWSSYRAAQTSNEQIVAGKWIENVKNATSSVPVSVDQRLMDKLHVRLGDELEFDVHGMPLRSVITSVRDVEWMQMRRNSFLIFPEGVLESAPQFFLFSLRVEDPKVIGELARAVSRELPNVSALDLRDILDRVDHIFERISFGLTILNVLVFAAAILVLLSTVVLARRERVREMALLQVLGARASTVAALILIEYSIVVSLACASGAAVAALGGVIVGRMLLRADATTPFLSLGILLLVVAVIVSFVAYYATKIGLRYPPILALRNE